MMQDLSKYYVAIEMYKDQPARSQFVAALRARFNAISSAEAFDIWQYIDAAADIFDA